MDKSDLLRQWNIVWFIWLMMLLLALTAVAVGAAIGLIPYLT